MTFRPLPLLALLVACTPTVPCEKTATCPPGSDAGGSQAQMPTAGEMAGLGGDGHRGDGDGGVAISDTAGTGGSGGAVGGALETGAELASGAGADARDVAPGDESSVGESSMGESSMGESSVGESDDPLLGMPLGEAEASGAGTASVGDAGVGQTVPCTPGDVGCITCAPTFAGEDNVGCGGDSPWCLTPELAWELTQAAQLVEGVPEQAAANSSAPIDLLVAATGVPAEGRCVPCLQHADCGDGVCVDYACVPCAPGIGASSLYPDVGCSGTHPVCIDAPNPADRACDCVSSNRCDDREAPFCSNKGCTGCTTNAQCTARYDGAPMCDEATGRCERCTAHAECTTAGAAQCDVSTLTCVPCTEDGHCAGVEGKRLCNSVGVCVQCIDGRDVSACGEGACDPTTYRCVE